MSYFQNCVTGEFYHVFNKSIAGYKIFNTEDDYMRMVASFKYYRLQNVKEPLSIFLKSKYVDLTGFDKGLMNIYGDEEKIIQIIAFCIMPTHIHLLVKQLEDNGVTRFMRNILNSYTRFFNLTHHRKGPLWASKFKRVHIHSAEQLLHVTRYIHLNPATAYLTNSPENWPFSSFNEYIKTPGHSTIVCDYSGCLDIDPSQYRNFVNDRVSYQRELEIIKENTIF